MRILERYLVEDIDEVLDNDIRVRAIGRLDRLPARVREQVENVVERSANNQAMTVIFALSYGGRAEIVDAMRQSFENVNQQAAADQKLSPEELDQLTEAAAQALPYMPVVGALVCTLLSALSGLLAVLVLRGRRPGPPLPSDAM